MNTEQEVRPLPCPFCGGDAIVVGHGPYRVACMKCTASLPHLYVVTEAEAIAAWNRRSSDEQAEVVGPNLYSLPSRMKWCQPGDKQDHRYFLVRFDDADRGDAVFTDETEARDFFGRANTSWNCYLLGALPAHPSPAVAAGGVTVTAHPLTDAGYAELRVNGVRVMTMPSPAADEAVRCLTAALAVGDEGIREGAKDTVDYVMQYGGRCRDCADENGTCPGSGLPCDTDAARKAIGFVLRAVDYGQRNGYLPTPPSRGEGE